MRCIAYLLMLVLCSSSVSALDGVPTIDEITDVSSFENDMEGWTARGTDLEDNGIPWSITRSQERADDRNTSLKFDLTSSVSKIWIEKQLITEPNRFYDVSIEYALASTGGDLGAYTMITGALKAPPQTRIDLIPAYKDFTSNENSSPGVYAWAKRKYEFTVQTGNEATVYAVIGIWGTSGLRHIVYVDSVRVTLTLKEGCEFYSFENDLEGWTTNAADLGSAGSGDWSIAQTQEIWEGGNSSVRFGLNNLNDEAKIWVERAFAVEPRNKYKVSVEYAFRSRDIGDIPGFRIITGVFRNHPDVGSFLERAFQEKTISPHGTWGWLHKSYGFTVKSKKENRLYLVIGIKATQEAQRIYWIDSVCVTITPK